MPTLPQLPSMPRFAPVALALAAALGVSLSGNPAAAQSPAQPSDTARPPASRPAGGADSAAVRAGNRASPGVATLAPVQVVARPERGVRYAAPGTLAATRTATPLRDVPQSVTVITRELIRDQAMRGMADVVRYVPGVTIGQGEGNRDQVTIRGNASSADFFLDGVRDDAQYYRDLYNLERVEVLKGANALLFGRGGGGGVLDRVTKQPRWTPVRELALEGGSFGEKRVALDAGQGITPAIAARVNAVYEHSGFYRDDVTLERWGINPVVTLAPGSQRTQFTLGYEYFRDRRTADRGIPSYRGLPLATGIATFFGDPDLNYAHASVSAAQATVAHETPSGVRIRNHTRFAAYDKIYQNVYPGAVNAAGDLVTLSAYNHATPRRSLFNQTDVTFTGITGRLRHTVLAGAEVGRQTSDNLRNTGWFGDSARTIQAPVAQPTIDMPVTFRQSATDADGRVTATSAAAYLQDQLALSARWQLVAGARWDRFAIRYRDNRSGRVFARTDGVVSPRFGVLFTPAAPVTLYVSRSVSFLPSAGDQFSSLTDVTQALAPERFTTWEMGARWDVAGRLALTTAVYRLDRTNTRASDPRDPTLFVQTGSQRTTGFELGASGAITDAWSVAGGYARQDAVVTSATAAAPAGARPALVPRHTVSLWNRHRLTRSLGVGLGVVHRSRMYAAIDDAVTLPGYTELDGALYATLGPTVRAQLYLENALDVRYYQSANGNDNITPGSPRAVRVSLTTTF